MIWINAQTKELVLQPKAKSKQAELSFPLHMAYTCPNCQTVIQGLFETDREINVSVYAEANLKHRPSAYGRTMIQLLGGQTGQLFVETSHFRSGTLQEAFNQAQPMLPVCHYIKATLEQVPLRAMQQLLHLAQGLTGGLDTELITKVYAQALENEKVAPFVLEKLQGQFGVAKDLVGEGPPIYLFSRHGLRPWDIQTILRKVVPN